MLLQPAANGNHLAFGLDNKASECDLAVGKKLLLKAFISKSGVRNFLNLPYASIPARFKTARLLCLEDLEGVIDARYYGPRCPQGMCGCSCSLSWVPTEKVKKTDIL